MQNFRRSNQTAGSSSTGGIYSTTGSRTVGSSSTAGSSRTAYSSSTAGSSSRTAGSFSTAGSSSTGFVVTHRTELGSLQTSRSKNVSEFVGDAAAVRSSRVSETHVNRGSPVVPPSLMGDILNNNRPQKKEVKPEVRYGL